MRIVAGIARFAECGQWESPAKTIIQHNCRRIVATQRLSVRWGAYIDVFSANIPDKTRVRVHNLPGKRLGSETACDQGERRANRILPVFLGCKQP